MPGRCFVLNWEHQNDPKKTRCSGVFSCSIIRGVVTLGQDPRPFPWKRFPVRAETLKPRLCSSNITKLYMRSPTRSFGRFANNLRGTRCSSSEACNTKRRTWDVWSGRITKLDSTYRHSWLSCICVLLGSLHWEPSPGMWRRSTLQMMGTLCRQHNGLLVPIGVAASPGKHGRHTGSLSHTTRSLLLSPETLISALIRTRTFTILGHGDSKRTTVDWSVATSKAIIGLLSFATSSLLSSVPTQPVSTASLSHQHP